MGEVFEKYNETGVNGLLRTPGIVNGLAKLLVSKFPGYTPFRTHTNYFY